MGIQSLYECGEYLYYNNINNEKIAYAHLLQFIDIEVVIDTNGDFISAEMIMAKDEMTLIPSTIMGEERSNSDEIPSPFGLHDTLIHVAGDYSLYFGKSNVKHFELYLKQLNAWCNSGKANLYIESIFKYVRKGCLIQDVKSYINNIDIKDKIRFAVITALNEIYKPWKDIDLINSYAEYYHNVLLDNDTKVNDFCYLTGEASEILHNAGRCNILNMTFAKLFTKDDKNRNFTYKGRFASAYETAWIGKRTSFTINYALRWLTKYRSIKVGEIYYIFFDLRLRSKWHVFNSTESIMKIFGLSSDNINTNFLLLEEKMIETIGTDNKLICFGIGALTIGRINLYDYREYVGTDIKKIIHNIVLYHSKYTSSLFKRLDLIKVIASVIGIKQINAQDMKLDIKKSSMVLIHEYVRIFLDYILYSIPIPNYIIEKAVSNVSIFLREKSIDRASILKITSLLVRSTINMNDENFNISYNEDVQIIAGRLFAILHWQDFRLKYYLFKKHNGNDKLNVWSYASLAYQYLNDYRMYPYRTWIQLNLQLYNIEKKLNSLGKESFFCNKLKSKFENILYNNNFQKLHHLDGRILLGFEIQINDFLSNKKFNKQCIDMEEEDSNES